MPSPIVIGLLVLLGAILVAVSMMAVIGSRLPLQHRATMSACYHRPPAAIWECIFDAGGQAAWRRELRRVERLPDRDGKEAFCEHHRRGMKLTMVTEEARPPHLLVRRIDDPALPFGGTWTFEIEPDGASSRLRITEEGEIRKPFFRFMARFVFGYAATMTAFSKALGHKLGEEVEVE